MTRILLAAAFLISAGAARAESVCTILADSNSPTVFLRDGAQCGAPTSPASTFKVPLALMGFDAGALIDSDQPLWLYKPEYRAVRETDRRAINPTSWMRDSVLWYSREITRALGSEKFKRYVDGFKYGDRDISGDPGRNNGLTNAWLSSSLKISPDGQIDFLRRVWNRRLPIQPAAYDKTFAIIPPFPLADGWIAYGKTGSGYERNAAGKIDRERRFGWFIGWAVNGDRTVLFARLVRETGKAEGHAGPRARDAMLKELPGLLGKI